MPELPEVEVLRAPLAPVDPQSRTIRGGGRAPGEGSRANHNARTEARLARRHIHRPVATGEISSLSTPPATKQCAGNIAGTSGHDRPHLSGAAFPRRCPNTPQSSLISAAKKWFTKTRATSAVLTLDTTAVEIIGPEPLDDGFDVTTLARALKRSGPVHQSQTAGPDPGGGHREHLRQRSVVSRRASRRSCRRAS